MKLILIISLILNLFSTKLEAQYKIQTKSETEVELLLLKQEVFWNNGDIKGFMSMYWKNDSLKFIGSKGITYGWQITLENYLKAYPDRKAMGNLKFTIIENKQVGENYIYIIGKWALEKEKPINGHFTLLWKRIKNEWVIVADHTS